MDEIEEDENRVAMAHGHIVVNDNIQDDFQPPEHIKPSMSALQKAAPDMNAMFQLLMEQKPFNFMQQLTDINSNSNNAQGFEYKYSLVVKLARNPRVGLKRLLDAPILINGLIR